MQGDIRRIAAMWVGSVLAGLATVPVAHEATVPDRLLSHQEAQSRNPDVYIRAYVTGYNTVVGQTDDTPCIGALGTNICGRRNVVACPRTLELGTMVEINGQTYICEDRTASKFRDRFDINCDQDKRCPYQVSGWANIKLLLD